MSSLAIHFVPDALQATATLSLAGAASYREAPELRRVMFEAISVAEDKNLVVDLEQIESMDTAAMAVLVEALMATRDGEPAIFLMCPSESVRRIFRLAGLEEALTRCYTCWDDLTNTIPV